MLGSLVIILERTIRWLIVRSILHCPGLAVIIVIVGNIRLIIIHLKLRYVLSFAHPLRVDWLASRRRRVIIGYKVLLIKWRRLRVHRRLIRR